MSAASVSRSMSVSVAWKGQLVAGRHMTITFIFQTTVKLQWLEHIWGHENMFETGRVRAFECKS